VDETPQAENEAARAGAPRPLPRDLLFDVFRPFPGDDRDESIGTFSRFMAEIAAGAPARGIHLMPDGRLIEPRQPGFAKQQTGTLIADTKIAQIFEARYGAPLTEAELRLLRGLVAGMSLKEISAADGVSYQTRRNQLKAVMEKSGATRQAELVATMTTLLVLSATRNADDQQKAQGRIRSFLDEFYPTKARVYSPHFGAYRSLLVLDLGPTDGMPVLHMHSAFFPVFPFPSEMALLDELNLRVITPMRPGFFGMPVAWETPVEERVEGFTTALAGFLEDFDLADAPVFCHAHGIISAVSLCRRLGNRVPRLVVHGGQHTAPEQQVRHPPHIRAHFKLLEKSPRLLLELYRLLAQAVARPAKLHDTLAKVFGKSAADMSALSDPARQAWLYQIISRVGRDNVPGIVADTQAMQTDWVSQLTMLPMPVTLFYGRDDRYSNFDQIAAQVAGTEIDLRLQDDQGLISMMFQPETILTYIAAQHPCKARKHETVTSVSENGTPQ